MTARQKAASQLGKAKVRPGYCRSDSWPSIIPHCQAMRRTLTIHTSCVLFQLNCIYLKLQAEAAKQMRGDLRYTSLDAIDARIEELQHKQETTSMSLPDEKALMKEISTLRAQRGVSFASIHLSHSC